MSEEKLVSEPIKCFHGQVSTWEYPCPKCYMTEAQREAYRATFFTAEKIPDTATFGYSMSQPATVGDIVVDDVLKELHADDLPIGCFEKGTATPAEAMRIGRLVTALRKAYPLSSLDITIRPL